MFLTGILISIISVTLIGVFMTNRHQGVPFPTPARRRGLLAVLGTFAVIAAGPILAGSNASAAIVPTVGLGTAGNYAVLGGETVTNTGPTTMGMDLGVWPGSSITGFPPGLVNAPGTIHTTDAAAQLAQSDLTTAYDNAAGRPLNATTTSDLVGLTLQGGVYAGTDKSPLSLSGTLVLDGAGDPNSVFIFQTDSTLITSSSSTVSLINGAQECNVFWQVGSSATLGTGSVFVGNILALTSVTVTTDVTVHGRALARTGAVTLDSDTFTTPTCDLTPPTTPPTSGDTTPTSAGPPHNGGNSDSDLGPGGRRPEYTG
jgi:hypothetical protein